MLSLSARQLIAAGLVLLAFLSITGLVLYQAFRDSALLAVKDRLQAQVYMLLSAADLNEDRQLTIPQALPEARFSNPESGLYAVVLDQDNRRVWRSESLLGFSWQPPTAQAPLPGDTTFIEIDSANGPLFLLGFTVSWEIAAERYREYHFWVAETRRGFDSQVNRFRRSLWTWLMAAAIVLLAVQSLILRWSLQPLRRIAREVTEIESGQRSELSGPYPTELQALTDNLNQLIRRSRSHLERYRNALGDLAHSLKTPLAVMRSAVEKPAARDELRETVHAQVERMNQTVDYQLQRAAASGRIALTSPVEVAPVVRKITDSLSKVYREKSVQFFLDIDKKARFYGDEGDLMEILGNLADNACKWAGSRVKICASADIGDSRLAALSLTIEDDGPGIPADQIDKILDRGGRADPNTPGHGIGLAIVRDIVEEVYQGQLKISRSEWGGLSAQVFIRPLT
jgi:two-component system sensor histidine kinase PhoQ